MRLFRRAGGGARRAALGGPALLLLLSVAPPAVAEQIDLVVSLPAGRGVAALEQAIGGLRALEGDREGGRLAMAPLGETAARRKVLYLDLASSRPASVRRVLSALIDAAGTLSQLRGFEIVVADPRPRTLVTSGTSAEEMGRILSRVSLVQPANDEVARLREDFLDQRRTGELEPAELTSEAFRLELELRQRQRDTLLLWLADQGESDQPRQLILMNDNLGMEMRDFYAQGAPLATMVPPELGTPAPTRELARALAVYGWTLMPLVAGEQGSGRLRYEPTSEVPVGFKLGLGGRRQAEAGSDAEQSLGLTARNGSEIDALAELTGGAVLEETADLLSALEAFSSRPVLRYEPREGLLGEIREFTIEGDGLEVKAAAFIGSGTPEPVAEARARQAILGASTEAELPVRSAIEFDRDAIGEELNRFEVRVDLFELRARGDDLDTATFRITVGVHLEDGQLRMLHELVRNVDLGDRSEWLHTGTLRLPAGTDGAVVLVELLESGDWGESFASFVADRSRLAAASEDLSVEQRDAGLVRVRNALRLKSPPGGAQIGRTLIRTEVERTVRRVIFLLDGKKVRTQRKPPFDALIDVGPTPRQRWLVAIAYDANGVEIGRDGLLLNQVPLSFSARIVEPRSGRRIGPVDVRVELRLPVESRLDRLEFYWQDKLIGTSRAEPFSQRVFIPVAAEPGLIRVAAHLEDGRIAEDVVLMNAERFADHLTVRLVELYVVVTDRGGKPVLGLSRADFTILEEQLEQPIESFEIAGSLPITVGLAIDSSLSLFIKMPEVRVAAEAFVDGLRGGQDRAFLVGFGSSPQVIRATTGDLGSVTAGIGTLRPGGTTALWEAVVLSLVQLQESSGRRALVVFYDGDDEDQDFSFGSAFKLARESGVPIYLIVMNNAAARSNGNSFGTKSRAGRLDRLARAGGGRVFYVRTDQDLGQIFSSIRDELRSHYLLTYYPRQALPGENPEWRPIQVVVNRRGLTARTLSGYGDLLNSTFE